MLTPRQIDVSPASLTAEQRLAAAVLRQAVADVQRSATQQRRRHAAAFLMSTSCDWWCGVAGLSVALVRQRARRFLGGSGVL